MLAVDTETRSLIYREGHGTVFMVQWADAKREYFATEDTGWQPFLDAIAQHDILVFANASFDVHHLRASGIVNVLDGRWRVHDVQTLARVAIPGRYGYKLEQLGKDLIGEDATAQQQALRDAAKRHKIRWTKEEKDYYGLWRLEPRLMEMYGMEDVRLTWDLWHHIWTRASAKDRDVYKMEIAGVAPLLREMEWEGVLVDQERVALLKTRLTRERDELRAAIIGAGIPETALGELTYDEDTDEWTVQPASTKDLRNGLIGAGVPLYRMTAKSGELAVNKDALKEFEGSHPVVTNLLAWRNRNLLLKTYVAALETASPRVHTSFNQVIARTGRMSASRPNMQNLPTAAKERDDGTYEMGVRHVLIPEPGNALLVADFEGIEVRGLAYYLNNKELNEKLDAGLDLPQQVAYDVSQAAGKGGAFEDFLKGKGPRAEERDKAKVTLYTSMYGGGASLLSTRLGIPVAEAAKIKQDTLNAVPGYFELDSRLKRTVRRRMFPHVVTITGRRLHVPRDKPYVALNTIIQGTAADLMKLAMIAAAPVLARYGYRLRLVVHDELVAEGPAHLADEALAAMIDAMENAYPLRPALKATGSWSTDSYGKAK